MPSTCRAPARPSPTSSSPRRAASQPVSACRVAAPSTHHTNRMRQAPRATTAHGMAIPYRTVHAARGRQAPPTGSTAGLREAPHRTAGWARWAPSARASSWAQARSAVHGGGRLRSRGCKRLGGCTYLGMKGEKKKNSNPPGGASVTDGEWMRDFTWLRGEVGLLGGGLAEVWSDDIWDFAERCGALHGDECGKGVRVWMLWGFGGLCGGRPLSMRGLWVGWGCVLLRLGGSQAAVG